ncbi:MAG: transcription termination factor NusA [Bacteroidales bacterium]|uniref:transcription termination factor NusA n=1 Tax=Porphyromonas sp. TaxID=1924944 RepID=UPI00297784A9|nr:transcription termination factor NusA [Porphyromonas sp.]MDD7438700.1 transcription termination factor NusA [Bacteroidales bacterium]MDY3066958.1 transcription termination factor NusA [Porphyromonas sp.]
MAKRKEPTIVEALTDYMGLKSIDEDTMVKVMEESLRNVIAKMFGTDHNFDVIVNPLKGDLEMWRRRIVVEDGEVQNPMQQISLSELRALGEEDVELGEEFIDEVKFESFGRRAILNLKQSLASKVTELEKDTLYANYSKRVGEMIGAEIYQVWKKEVLLMDDEENELILPKQLAIPRDRFKKGDRINAVIDKVEYNNNNPKIILSRVSDKFVMRLFEREVPEIQDGLVTIRAVARIPGEKAKVAVESYDERIDPVGAVVGVRGSRIQGVVAELCNESIDVIQWTSNPVLMIQRALAPAKNLKVQLNEESRRAEVYVPQDQISEAIGKGGKNIKLAGMLTGYEIDIYRDESQDMDMSDLFLTEFDDEIDMWVIDTFKSIGCDTAKSVLRRSVEELVRATDLETSTVENVMQILMTEFSDEELPREQYGHLPERDPRYYPEAGATTEVEEDK